MIDFNPAVGSVFTKAPNSASTKPAEQAGQVNFGKAVEKYMSEVNDLQNGSDESIVNMLTGKNQDINSVVSAVAKADMSFKLLVNVRNKIIEAYKQTMQMPL